MEQQFVVLSGKAKVVEEADDNIPLLRGNISKITFYQKAQQHQTLHRGLVKTLSHINVTIGHLNGVAYTIDLL